MSDNTATDWNRPPTMAKHSVMITAKRWFDRSAGNTYFSAQGYVDGEHVASIDYEYGYDEHCLEQMHKELIRKGYLPEPARKNTPAWCHIRDELGLKWAYEITDVARKGDL